MVKLHVIHFFKMASTVWFAADGGPEPAFPALAFMDRQHCELLQNAKQFRKAKPPQTVNGKFDRKGRRTKNPAREYMAGFFRTLLHQHGSDPALVPSAPSNTRALKACIAAWSGHWFFGTIVKTDAKWWDEEQHGLLQSTEGTGETQEGFLKGIMANQRQHFKNRVRKATAMTASSPVSVVNIHGGGGKGINITTSHSSVTVNSAVPALASARQPTPPVSDDDEQGQDDDDEEDMLLEKIRLLE